MAMTMAAPDEWTVRARIEGLAEAIEFVEAFCADRGVAESDGLRLSLVLEELFTNTVVHGHGGGSDAPVRLTLHADASHLELSYQDSAPPFDPLAHVAAAPIDPAAGVADRPIGHLGIPLIVNMAERISYVHEGGCNRIRLALRREAGVNTPGDPA
jgi:serine/threonine-protein kinase RsbW